MVSLSQRFKAFINPPAPQPARMKSSQGWGMLDGGVPTIDLSADSPVVYSKYGAATASLVNHAAYTCINTRAETVASAPWRVVDTRTGNILGSSADTDTKEAVSGALHRFSGRDDGISLFYLWELHKCITGEAYIELCRTASGGIEFDWLNSLNVSLTIVNGQIVNYVYTGYDRRSSVTLPYNRVVYDRYRNNIMTEYYGYSPIMAAIGSKAVPIMSAAGQAALAYFNNDGMPRAVVSPDSATHPNGWKDDELSYIQKAMRGGKSASGKYRTMAFPYPFKSDIFEAPDLQSWAELLNRIEPQIYTAYRVPRSIAGDSDSQRYQASPEDAKTFDRVMLSELKNIAGVVNTRMIPAVYGYKPAVLFEFETARFEHIDREERDAAEAAYDRGVITVNEYRAVIGFEALAQPAPVPEATPAPAQIEAVATPPQVETPAAPITVERDALAAKLDELRTWERYAATGKARPFEPAYLNHDTAEVIRFELQDAPARSVVFKTWRAVLNAEAGVTNFDSLKAADYPPALVAYKTCLDEAGIDEDTQTGALKAHYAAIVASKRATAVTQMKFTNEFNRLIQRAVDEKMRKSVFIRNLTITIDRYSRSAFIDGYYDAGVYGYEPDGEDLNWILRWTDTQVGYVEDFATRVYADNEVTASDFNERADMWFNKSILPAYNEGFLRASKDGAFMWRRGATSDSCEDCLRLDRKVYRLSMWKSLLGNTLPPCNATECNGYKCLCEVVPVRDSLTRGRPVVPRGARKEHTHHVLSMEVQS